MTNRQYPSPSFTLAPDSLLPQRDTLLNAHEMARRFSTLLGTSATQRSHALTRCEWTRAKYRIGESLRVLYHLQIGTTTYAVTGRTFRNGASAQAHQVATRTTLPCGPLPAVVHDPTLDTVFWTFPNDRKIAHLSLLDNVPSHVSQLLAQTWRESRLVSYAPERAAIAQCLSADGTLLAYAKLYAGTEGAQSYAIHNALCQHVPIDDPHLRLPRAFAYTESERLLLLEPIAGRHAEALEDDALPDATRRFGAAVARLHVLPPPPNVPEFSHLTVSALHTAARVLAQVRPDILKPWCGGTPLGGCARHAFRRTPRCRPFPPCSRECPVQSLFAIALTDAVLFASKKEPAAVSRKSSQTMKGNICIAKGLPCGERPARENSVFWSHNRTAGIMGLTRFGRKRSTGVPRLPISLVERALPLRIAWGKRWLLLPVPLCGHKIFLTEQCSLRVPTATVRTSRDASLGSPRA
jgi:hypothetical protein